MQPTHRVISLFNRAASSLSQGHWFSFLVWQCNNHKFAQEVTSPLSWLPVYSVYARVPLSVNVYLNVHPTGSREKQRTKKKSESRELQSYCSEHGCITEGGYGTGCESAETDRPIEPDSPGAECIVQHIPGLTENLMKSWHWQDPQTVGSKPKAIGFINH